MLSILRDQVLIYQEKAIVWTMFPAEQAYIGAALVEANIDAKVFHASLGFSERASLINEFTTERDKCMVLICSYSVNAAGLSLQELFICFPRAHFPTWPGRSQDLVDQDTPGIPGTDFVSS
ncbi:hypothetical protein CDV55_101290 [Aspergillus turcosus]|uniref:Helicase C-terminal domain-containing protein n=1 Tax=Aspergillus turcosus TaxID=1245748 RepID=A0A229YUH9_9EURO|nr:hypothetical protein CDV55_101290 [Aspergillus turcosus]RLL98132.1 hypothetical protein CFD26_106572 [Aspergillus turcosus]